MRNRNLNLLLQRGGAAIPTGDRLQGGGPHPAEGEGAALHAPAGAAAPGPLRPLLGAGVGRLLRGHRVQHQGILHLQGESDRDLHVSIISFHLNTSVPFSQFYSICALQFHFHSSSISQFYSIFTFLFQFHSSSISQFYSIFALLFHFHISIPFINFFFHSSIPFLHFCSIFTVLFRDLYTSVPFSQLYSICTHSCPFFTGIIWAWSVSNLKIYIGHI